jgi:exonuclease III
MDKEPLGLLSLNANGLGDEKKRISLIRWLNSVHTIKEKIIFLQETHSTEKVEAKWKKEWGNHEVYFSHGSSGSKGVATAIPKEMEKNITDITRSKNGRYIVVNLIINEQDFCLVNCYAPCVDKPKDQLQWLSEIQPILETNSDANIIVGGDLNDVFIPSLDRYRCKPRAVETEYVKTWKTVCEEANLGDVWRILNPDRKCYTWRQGSSATRLKQSRLDYWLISVHMFYDLENVDIKASFRSDHSLIVLNFYKNTTPKRGPSFWRFNANLLKDRQFVESTKENIVNALEKYSEIEDKGLKWDLVKMEVRSSTICFSKNKAKENREQIKETMVRVDKLEK